jgi:hypothetical protein
MMPHSSAILDPTRTGTRTTRRPSSGSEGRRSPMLCYGIPSVVSYMTGPAGGTTTHGRRAGWTSSWRKLWRSSRTTSEPRWRFRASRITRRLTRRGSPSSWTSVTRTSSAGADGNSPRHACSARAPGRARGPATCAAPLAGGPDDSGTSNNRFWGRGSRWRAVRAVSARGGGRFRRAQGAMGAGGCPRVTPSK